MQKVRVPLTNFGFGEVSPSLYSRVDLPIYNQSAQRIENFFLRSEGGIIKRSGLQYLYEYDTTVDTSQRQQCRLLPYVFSDDEQYIISLEHQQIRIFQIDPSTGDVNYLQTITTDVDTATLKFDQAYLHEYTFAQAGDVMFICHQTFVPQLIVRTSLTTFQVESFEFATRSDAKVIYQPYHKFQTAGMTLDPSGTSGSVSLTTSAAYWDIGELVTADVAAGSFVTGTYYRIDTVGTTDFTLIGANSNTVGEIFKATGAGTGTGLADEMTQSKHIGTTVRYNKQEIEITHVRTNTVAVGTVQEELTITLVENSFRTNNGSNKVEVLLVDHGLKVGDSVTFSLTQAVGSINPTNLNGTRTVSAVIDNDQFEFTAGGTASESELGGGTPRMTTHAPITNWDEQSYSVLRGYPAAVTFHQSRLVLGGTLAQPDTIWFSKTNAFFNFDAGAAKDNESITLSANVGEIQQIRHLVSNRDLQVFSASAEFYVPAFQNQPLTPTNAQIRRQTPFGSEFERPQVMDGATVFVQKGGQIAREYIFSDTEAAYVANPISSLASHLIKTPIEMNTLYGALSRSENYVFVLNADGTIAVFNSNRAEQRAGWVEFTTDGVFHSITTVDDRVFANVEFDIGDGTTKIILCEFNTAFNTDMAGIYSGIAGVFDVSGQFADGAVLQVIDGDNFVGEFTVASGNIDVSGTDNTLTTVEIGKKFDVTLKTNPIEAAMANGPVTGLPRGISSVFLDLNETLSCKVNSTNLVVRTVASPQPTPFTGKKEFRILGYSTDPQVTITQDAPLNLQINGLIAELVI